VSSSQAPKSLAISHPLLAGARRLRLAGWVLIGLGVLYAGLVLLASAAVLSVGLVFIPLGMWLISRARTQTKLIQAVEEYNTSYRAFLRGDLDSAKAAMQRIERDVPQLRSNAAHVLGMIARESGEFEEAERRLRATMRNRKRNILTPMQDASIFSELALAAAERGAEDASQRIAAAAALPALAAAGWAQLVLARAHLAARVSTAALA
jgi:hypothetical protein